MAQDKMTLEDWLDDLGVRFLINLPQEDLRDIARFCFQIEEAQWFYEDFIRPLDPTLPSMSLKSFSLKMFQHCPLFSAFSPDDHLRAFEQFMEYKTRVPVRGAIMLNTAMDSAVLVKGYKKGASWSFPRGKINKDEPDLNCAIREVYEETGFDLHEAGLVERNVPVDYLEVTLKDQQVRLFIFRDVPQDTFFEPKTRKEIGDIKWYKLTDLPAYRKRKVAGKAQGNGTNSNDKFYMVAPFMVQLRQWILKQRKLDPRTAANGPRGLHSVVLEEELTEDNTVDKPAADPTGIPDSSAEYIDKATKELRDALLGPFAASQSKDLPPSSHPDAGQAILGLLRNTGVPENSSARPTGVSGWGGEEYRRPTQHPITPLDHISTGAHQPDTPHHHHATQRVPLNSYDRPPPFPVAPNADTSYMQQRQSRPAIQMTTDASGLPTIQYAPRYYQDKPLQLQHPQPLPPQVHGDKLIQSMMTPPMIPDPNIRAPPSDTLHNNQNLAQAHHQGHGSQANAPAPHRLPAHSLNLLNALKGDNGGAAHHTFQAHPNMQQGASTTTTQHEQSFFTTSRRDSGNQNGMQVRSGNTNTLATDKAQYSPQDYPVSPRIRSPNASDKHRSALLEMFKKGESSVPQSQLDGQSAGMRSSPRSANPNEGRSMNQSPSTAEASRSATREKKAPLEMNPETNLPYGAVSILARPQSGKSANRPESSAQRSDASLRQRHTPSSPLAKGAQSYHSLQSKMSNSRSQWASQPRPTLAQAYPYGTSQGTGTSPFSMLPSPPAASTFPVPGMLQPRQDANPEHRNTLLSLFGKQQSSGLEQQGKGKEAAGADFFTGGVPPRSRMASVNSSRGEGSGAGVGMGGGLTDNPNPMSRRGSQTPLSPADRNFLLGFLENKARQ